MGMRVSTPVISTPVATTAPTAAPKAISAPVDGKKKEVRGQVAMHAIMTGYEVASRMAAILAASPDKVEERLHKLAVDVAQQIEAYTFKGE